MVDQKVEESTEQSEPVGQIVSELPASQEMPLEVSPAKVH